MILRGRLNPDAGSSDKSSLGLPGRQGTPGVWAATVTCRGDTIRIISIRRADGVGPSPCLPLSSGHPNLWAAWTGCLAGDSVVVSTPKGGGPRGWVPQPPVRGGRPAHLRHHLRVRELSQPRPLPVGTVGTRGAARNGSNPARAADPTVGGLRQFAAASLITLKLSCHGSWVAPLTLRRHV